MARVRFPDSVSYICGLSLLLVLVPAPRGFFSGYSGFPLSAKTNISNFQFDLDYSQALYHEPLVGLLVRTLKIEPRYSTQAFTRRVNFKVFNPLSYCYYQSCDPRFNRITSLFTLQLFLYDSTMIAPFPLLFFGGDISVLIEEGQETVAVDEFIKFKSPTRIANLVKVGVSWH